MTPDVGRYLSEVSRKPSRYRLVSECNHPVDDGQGNSPFGKRSANPSTRALQSLRTLNPECQQPERGEDG